jgi:hypothetical protein
LVTAIFPEPGTELLIQGSKKWQSWISVRAHNHDTALSAILTTDEW